LGGGQRCVRGFGVKAYKKQKGKLARKPITGLRHSRFGKLFLREKKKNGPQSNQMDNTKRGR